MKTRKTHHRGTRHGGQAPYTETSILERLKCKRSGVPVNRSALGPFHRAGRPRTGARKALAPGTRYVWIELALVGQAFSLPRLAGSTTAFSAAHGHRRQAESPTYLKPQDSRPKTTYHAKCANALLASAMRCVCSRVFIALPSLRAASQSSLARRWAKGLPFSARTAVMIQRKHRL